MPWWRKRLSLACVPVSCHKLKRLCRYILRPAVSKKRLSLIPSGNILYQLGTPYSNGTMHVIF
ncbi:MAG: hypothetical protein B6D71_15250 [gamma proteobacterium symbiont of Stewartia floridana]|nr:MAG: hypothetical protein B6D71_15250 [gamma proteobacterium symbiont of Stewartia floridana]